MPDNWRTAAAECIAVLTAKSVKELAKVTWGLRPPNQRLEAVESNLVGSSASPIKKSSGHSLTVQSGTRTAAS